MFNILYEKFLLCKDLLIDWKILGLLFFILFIYVCLIMKRFLIMLIRMVKVKGKIFYFFMLLNM